MCISCLLSKQEKIISDYLDANRKAKYVSAGNYIDFSAVENVNEQTLNTLLDRAEKESVPENEYVHFRNDLEQTSRLVYLTDNCGEIVLDKLFIKCLRKWSNYLREQM